MRVRVRLHWLQLVSIRWVPRSGGLQGDSFHAVRCASFGRTPSPKAAGSKPARPNLHRLATRNPHGCPGQTCRKCRSSARGAVPGAVLEGRGYSHSGYARSRRLRRTRLPRDRRSRRALRRAPPRALGKRRGMSRPLRRPITRRRAPTRSGRTADAIDTAARAAGRASRPAAKPSTSRGAGPGFFTDCRGARRSIRVILVPDVTSRAPGSARA